jgi:hypothetical protein
MLMPSRSGSIGRMRGGLLLMAYLIYITFVLRK